MNPDKLDSKAVAKIALDAHESKKKDSQAKRDDKTQRGDPGNTMDSSSTQRPSKQKDRMVFSNYPMRNTVKVPYRK